MIRGVLELTPRPGMAAADRAARRSGALRLALAIVAFATVAAPVLVPARSAHAKDDFPQGTITEVRIQGNVTISSEQVRAKLLSRAGSPLEQRKVDADIKSLVATKWFSEVNPYYSPDPNGQGFILTFAVAERPVLGIVEFRGRSKVSLKDIEEATGLKKGNRADPAKTHLAVGQIQRLYAEKGYGDAEVQLVEGGKTGDTKVVISIFEGEKHKVGGIDFEGNVFASDATLRLKVTSRTAILGLGGRYHRDNLDEDRRKLVEYYQGQGFYDVKVTPVTDHGASLGDVRLLFVISEGIRYKVRNVSFEGNKKIATEALRQNLVMHSGQPILDTLKELDRKTLIAKYNDLGCIDTQIIPDPRLTDQPGVVDLVYRIEEGDPYLLGELIIRGNERTRDKVLRREAANAGLLPGEVLNLNRIEAYKNRLSTLGYFVNAPDQGKQIEIKIVDRRPGDKPYGDNVTLDPNDVSLTRMQGPDSEPAPPVTLPSATPALALDPPPIPTEPLVRARLQNPDRGPEPEPIADARARRQTRLARPASGVLEGLQPFGTGNPFRKVAATATVAVSNEPPVRARLQNLDPGPAPPIEAQALPPEAPGPTLAPPAAAGPDGLQPFGAGNAFSPPPDSLPPVNAPVAPGGAFAPGPGAIPPTPPVGAGEPPGEFPSIPGMNMTDPGPDRQDPFPNRAFANIITSVEEAPTGRFMLGVGASGFQGLNATVSVNEKNFDVLKVPRSLDDITSGKAFRGGGQDFQMQLMVGTLINRFMVSLRDPYLFDLPIGAGATGYLFQRMYPDWTESRAGGRFSLGRQFGTATYADAAFRVENVQFYGYRTPAPAEFLAASGHSLLATIRPSIRFDNRNSPILPTKGQYLEFSFEQAWGTFTYPKVEVEGRKYFTLGSRPDGSGPRILTLRGHVGATGPDTPVYERFFAGYLGSLRGFAYRGVGPHVDNVNIGGTFMAVGSLEYMFPLTASDKVRQVIFTDFGTVNNQYSLDNFRASVGTGIRLTLPMMGPLPMAFDLAFPVLKAPGDRVNYFNFSIGAFY